MNQRAKSILMYWKNILKQKRNFGGILVLLTKNILKKEKTKSMLVKIVSKNGWSVKKTLMKNIWPKLGHHYLATFFID